MVRSQMLPRPDNNNNNSNNQSGPETATEPAQTLGRWIDRQLEYNAPVTRPMSFATVDRARRQHNHLFGAVVVIRILARAYSFCCC